MTAWVRGLGRGSGSKLGMLDLVMVLVLAEGLDSNLAVMWGSMLVPELGNLGPMSGSARANLVVLQGI